MKKEELIKLAKLCKIAYTDEELDEIAGHLELIVEHAESLKSIDTEGVPPCNHVLKDMEMPFREDKAEDLLDREIFLKNSPEHIGGMIRVPSIIKFENSWSTKKAPESWEMIL